MESKSGAASKQITIAKKNYFAAGTYAFKYKQQFKYAAIPTIITTTLLAPLERWRIIAQTQKTFPLRNKKFKSFFDYLARVPKEQGITAFWRGNTASLWIYLYQKIFQIGVYDSLRKQCKDLQAQLVQSPHFIPFFSHIVYPLFASFLTLGLVHPVDTYRIHKSMSYHKLHSQALFTKFRHRTSQVGSIKEMYRGFLLANVIGVINFNLFKVLYEVVGEVEVNGVSKQLVNTTNIITLLSVGLLHPLDTFKKIYQLNNLHKPSLFPSYRKVLDYLKQNKIQSSLFNGFTISIVKSALCIPIYWQLIKIWRKFVDESQASQKQN